MKKIIAFCMITVLLSVLGFSVCAQNNEGIKLNVRFDSAVYKTSADVAVATVYITGLEDGAEFGGLNTYLSFSAKDFEFDDTSSILTDIEADTKSVTCRTGANEGLISIILLDVDNITVHNNDAGEFEIAEIKLNVKAQTEKQLQIYFDEKNGVKPYQTAVLDTHSNCLSFEFSTPATANTVEGFAFSGDATPVQTGETITATPVVCTAGSPVMVTAKLHANNNVNLLAAPVIKFVPANSRQKLDVTFAYSDDATETQVTYYFWSLGAGMMKPIYNPVTLMVSK